MPQDTFAVAKIPSPNTPQSEQKNRAFGGFIFFQQPSGEVVELNCASLALRVFAIAKIPSPTRATIRTKKTALSHGFIFSQPSGVPTGIRTPVLGMKIQCPRPG